MEDGPGDGDGVHGRYTEDDAVEGQAGQRGGDGVHLAFGRARVGRPSLGGANAFPLVKWPAVMRRLLAETDRLGIARPGSPLTVTDGSPHRGPCPGDRADAGTVDGHLTRTLSAVPQARGGRPHSRAPGACGPRSAEKVRTASSRSPAGGTLSGSRSHWAAVPDRRA